MSTKKSVYEVLSKIDTRPHIKAVQGKKYISWSSQWNELKKVYPLSVYVVHEDDIGNPFFVSPVGIFVKVSVTIEDLTHTINYPVLDSANKSMKIDSYTYTTKKGDRHVEACNSFEVNTSIMRALTKCIALHGLSIFLYQDELQPDVETVDSKQLQAITDKIRERGLSLAEVCKSWNIGKVAEIHEANFDSFISWLDGAK